MKSPFQKYLVAALCLLITSFTAPLFPAQIGVINPHFLGASFSVDPKIAAANIAKKRENNVYSRIGDKFIVAPEAKTEEKVEEKPFLEKFFIPNYELTPLTKEEKQRIIFHSLFNAKPTNTILNEHGWHDLQLFDNANLLKNIDRTQTYMGQAVLAKLLVEPITDIKTLLRRQRIMQRLVADNTLYHTLRTSLKKLNTVESTLLQWWQSGWFLELLGIEQTKEESPSAINRFFKRLSKVLRHSPKVQETLLRFNEANFAFVMGLSSLGTVYPWTPYANQGQQAERVGLRNAPEFFDSQRMRTAEKVLISLYAAVSTIATWSGFKQIFIDNLQKSQQTLIETANAIAALRELYSTIAEQNSFAQDLPQFEHMEALIGPDAKISKDLKKLFNLLETKTFKGEPSFFSWQGRIMAATSLMNEIKDELKKCLEAAGTIDAFMSMATLYKELAKQPAQFCFVHFIEQNKPYFSLQGFWNPLLNSATAIPNDMILGNLAGQTVHSRSMILTGQNTAGKTTIIQGIMHAALLAQTFGIAPAKSVTMTPFAILDMHVNITDDIASGRSLFANEVYRAKELLSHVESTEPEQFSLTIIDEMFKGTGPEHAELLSYEYAKKLAHYPNAIIVESTHYKKLVDLETETNGIYKNYKIEINQNPDGSLTRPYKIENGYTITNIAKEILKEQGLSLGDMNKPFVHI
jgi:hypothetical protein